jgi:hypothetical protein
MKEKFAEHLEMATSLRWSPSRRKRWKESELRKKTSRNLCLIGYLAVFVPIWLCRENRMFPIESTKRKLPFSFAIVRQHDVPWAWKQGSFPHLRIECIDWSVGLLTICDTISRRRLCRSYSWRQSRWDQTEFTTRFSLSRRTIKRFTNWSHSLFSEVGFLERETKNLRFNEGWKGIYLLRRYLSQNRVKSLSVVLVAAVTEFILMNLWQA